MFGKAAEVPQTEATRFHPRSSYGISKVAGYELTRNYREAYGLRASLAFYSITNRPAAALNSSRAKFLPAWRASTHRETDHPALGNLDATQRLGTRP